MSIADQLTDELTNRETNVHCHTLAIAVFAMCPTKAYNSSISSVYMYIRYKCYLGARSASHAVRR